MKKGRDDEIEREIRAHLDLEVEERVAAGMSETDARCAARRAFGNVTRTQEDVRAVWTWRWLDEIVQDVRYALRTLRPTESSRRSSRAGVSVLARADTCSVPEST